LIYIGTSGYSYDDWIGPFYKEDTPKGEMLSEYSKVFGFTEINSTYYSMPNKFMFFNLVKKTPEGFRSLSLGNTLLAQSRNRRGIRRMWSGE
jgi:uncharacterized protein YecE (DUF72 family)